MTDVQQFQKKPVQIEAMQLDEENGGAVVGWINANGGDAVMRGGPGGGSMGGSVFIRTLEGTLHASVWDWVIRGIKGEFYPCKPDIFDETYDVVST